jgi:PKD repeat protein
MPPKASFYPHEPYHLLHSLIGMDLRWPPREEFMNPMRAIFALGIVFGTLAFLSCGACTSSNPSDPTVPTAGFTVLPVSPAVNQNVQFSDASTGDPTSWSWTFGDGGTSTAQNPSHVYSAAGTFTVTLTAGSLGGSDTVSHTVTVNPAAGTPSFGGNIVLGSPTTASIEVNIFSPDQDGAVYLAYGTSPDVYDQQTATAVLTAGKPLRLTMDGLSGDTRYYYRLYFQTPDGTGSGPTEEYTFHTARPAGSTFTFTIQADSHLDGNSDLELYRQTLANVLGDAPDFHVDLGDTFMCEKYSKPLVAAPQMAPDQATVDARYGYDRANFGIISHSAPLFLVNGNHEGELGWLADGTPNNIAIWTTRARQQYFLNPVPDDFYSGDSTEEPFVGKRASWYAWQWGDALFVVLDPYWYTMTKSNNDGWVYTLGERQHKWLQETLSASPATFKFVFIHSLVGGLDGQLRGGIEAAPFFEWGGRNLDGTMGFDQKRPGWSMPIHQLLVRYGVTAVFHGHDHLYAKQELDNVLYQEVPQPSAKNFSSGPSLATQYHYASGTILSSSGHLRVTVSPDRVTVQYVRAWLPKNETAQRKNGQVDDTWIIDARQAAE